MSTEKDSLINHAEFAGEPALTHRKFQEKNILMNFFKLVALSVEVAVNLTAKSGAVFL